MTGPTADVRRRYQRIAPFYDLLDLYFERRRYRRIRPLLFDGLSGRILDAGVGTGRNMPYYPANAHVVGVDLSAAMLQRARRRQELSPATVELAMMDLTRLGLADDTFDAAVASFVFCTLPGVVQVSALRELARVVKPDGCIRLLEYTRSEDARRQWLARLWAPWVRWAFGARLDQSIDRQIDDAGLAVRSRRFVIADQVEWLELRSQAGGGGDP